MGVHRLQHPGACVGANSTIVCGVTVGAYALVGAGADVTRDILRYALVYGIPARQYGWVSEDGLQLLEAQNNEFSCPETGKLYDSSPSGNLLPRSPL